MTLLGPPRRRREHRRFRPPQPPKQPDQHDQEAAARGAICEATMSSNGIHPRSHARSVRPAEALQPNSPSCGNQPANISLTAPSRTNTHATSSAWSGQRSGAREAIRAPLRPAPLTNRPTYQSPPSRATGRLAASVMSCTSWPVMPSSESRHQGSTTSPRGPACPAHLWPGSSTGCFTPPISGRRCWSRPTSRKAALLHGIGCNCRPQRRFPKRQ